MPRTLPGARRDDYLALVQAFPLRKIQSAAQRAQALRASGSLVGLHRKLTPGEGQYLDALVVLIRDYEQTHHDPTLRKTKGVDVLGHLMGERGMSQADLARVLGVGESAASMILAGKRELTKSHIAALSDHFGVGVSAFFD